MNKTLFLPIIDNGMGLSRTSWAVSMMALCKSNALKEYSLDLPSISYPYPDGAANIATALFLDSSADQMLIIDTDVVFTPPMVECLLSHDVPFVAGIYPKKEPGLNFPMQWMSDKNPFQQDLLLLDASPLVEVKATARGFMLLKREVFLKLLEANSLPSQKVNIPIYRCSYLNQDCHQFWQNCPGGHSEDFDFCAKWRAVGGKVMIDQRCVAQHEGSALYPIPGTYKA